MKEALIIWTMGICCVICSFRAAAQKESLWETNRWNVELGISAGGRSAGSMEFVGGWDMRVQKILSSRVAATLSAGFTRFFDINKNNMLYLPTGEPIHYGEYENYLNFIPLKAGAKVLFARNAYIGGEAGIGINLNGNSSFVWAPAVGIVLPTLDLSVRYEDFAQDHDAKQVAARLAFRLR